VRRIGQETHGISNRENQERNGLGETRKQGTEKRKKNIKLPKSQYNRLTMVLANTMIAQGKATECSLRISWILERHMKPFTDADVVQECMMQTAETTW